MADEKSGKKPDEQGGKGQDKGGEAEAGGRAKSDLWTCFNDGSGNYVDPSWTYFICWNCGALNYMNR